MDKKIIQKASKYFTETEKYRIIEELIATQHTKVEIWEKYTGEKEEPALFLRFLVHTTSNKTQYDEGRTYNRGFAKMGADRSRVSTFCFSI